MFGGPAASAALAPVAGVVSIGRRREGAGRARRPYHYIIALSADPDSERINSNRTAVPIEVRFCRRHLRPTEGAGATWPSCLADQPARTIPSWPISTNCALRSRSTHRSKIRRIGTQMEAWMTWQETRKDGIQTGEAVWTTSQMVQAGVGTPRLFCRPQSSWEAVRRERR